MSVLLFGLIILSLTLGVGFILVKKRETRLLMQLKQQASGLNEKQQSEQQLQAQLTASKDQLKNTFKDPVTHLVSWQIFADRLQQNIKESARHRFTLGLLFVDLNDFKTINDAYGHELADRVLQETANRLQACIRQIDSVSRFSKDTFVVMLTQLAKPETAVIVAQRMLQSIAEKYQIQDTELSMSCSIGMAFYPTDAQDAATLLRNADHALHLAKKNGKQGYRFYEERLQEKSQRELMLSMALNQESVYHLFQIYYQPIMNVVEQSTFAMDVSLTWQHPQLGVISAQEIYSHAERQRKSNVLTEWLLTKTIQQYKEWEAIGFKPAFLLLPVFPKQLESSQFIYNISQVLQHSAFPPDQVILMLDAGFSQVSFDILEKAFNMLKFMGIKMGIQCFSSGVFPLRYLQHLDIHFITLDRHVIEDIVASERSKLLVKSIIQMGQNLSINVIADGVQTSEQVAVLQSLGCSLMQGQLMGAPQLQQDIVHKTTA